MKMDQGHARMWMVFVLATACFVVSGCKKEQKDGVINLHQNPEVNLEKRADGLWISRVHGDVVLCKKSEGAPEDIKMSGVSSGMKLSENPEAKYYFDADSMKTYVFQNDESITMYEIRPNGDCVIYSYEKQGCSKSK